MVGKRCETSGGTSGHKSVQTGRRRRACGDERAQLALEVFGGGARAPNATWLVPVRAGEQAWVVQPVGQQRPMRPLVRCRARNNTCPRRDEQDGCCAGGGGG